MADSPITDQLLDAVRKQESGGDPFAISGKGAQGPYQFMPGTAKQFGVENPFDESQARAGAKRALQHYYDKYGSVDKALAAYNAGEGAVDKGGKLPKETRQYVKSISSQTGGDDPFASIVAQHSQPDKAEQRHTVPTTAAQQPPVPGQRQTPSGQAGPRLPYLLDRLKGGIQSALMAVPQAAETLVSETPLRYLAGGDIPFTQVAQEKSQQVHDYLQKNHPEVAKVLNIQNIPQPRDAFGAKRSVDRYLGNIAEFMGAGVIPGIGGLSGAERKIPYLVGEAMMSASGGFWYTDGEDIGRNLASKLGVSPERGAQIGAMMTSLVMPAVTKVGLTKAAHGIMAGAAKFSPAAREQRARAQTAEEMQGIQRNFPGAQPNVEEIERLRQQGLNIKPYLARATGAPEAVAKYQTAMGTSPEILAKGAAEEAAMKEEAQRFREEQFPSGAMSAQAGAEAATVAQNRSFTKQIQDTTTDIQRIAAKPSVDFVQAGQEMKAALGKHFDLRQKKAASNYQGFDEIARKQGVRLSSGEFYDTVSRIAGRDAAQWEETSPTVARILKEYAPKEVRGAVVDVTGRPLISRTEAPTISPTAWRGMIRKINRDLGELYASNTPDARSAARTLQRVKDAIEGQGRREMRAKPGVEEAWNAAQSYYADAIGKPFREGAVSQVMRRGRYGEVTVPSEVVGKIWSTPEGIEQYFAATKGDPGARLAYENGVIDMFYSKFATKGEINPQAVKAWMADSENARKLSLTPELKARLSNMADATETLLNRRSGLEAEQKVLNRSAVSRFAKTDTPVTFIDKALRSPGALKELVGRMKGNPEALKSLSSLIAERMTSVPNIEQFMRQNEEHLKPILDQLGPNHWNNLKVLGAEQRIRGRVVTPTHVTPPKAKGIVEETTGTKARSILGRLASPFRTNEVWHNVWLAGNFFMRLNEKAQKAAFESAYLNPDVTSVLADIQTKGPTKERVSHLKAALFSHGIRVAIVTGQKPQEDEQ